MVSGSKCATFTVLRLFCDCFGTVLRLIWAYFDEQALFAGV